MPVRPDPPVAIGATDLHGEVAVTSVEPITLRYQRRDATAEIELVGSAESMPDPELVDEVARTVADVRATLEQAGATVHLAADHPADAPDPLPEAVADALGLTSRRDLFLQLRRTLPVPADHPTRSAPSVVTRAFDPDPSGADRTAWIRTNNRAFVDHPDQGAETEATLAVRLAEPWFDPAGFFVADDPDRPGELAGFCWTKVHTPTAQDPALGEIYVIGVDPSHRGQGLGPSFVLAGLDHLAELGLTTANLYVEADNAPALRLYERLGFTVHRRRRVYSA